VVMLNTSPLCVKAKEQYGLMFVCVRVAKNGLITPSVIVDKGAYSGGVARGAGPRVTVEWGRGVVRDFGIISTLGDVCVDGTERGGPVEAGQVALLCGNDFGTDGCPVVGVAGGERADEDQGEKKKGSRNSVGLVLRGDGGLARQRARAAGGFNGRDLRGKAFGRLK